MASVLDSTGPAPEASSAEFRQVATVPGGVVAVVAISTATAALIAFDLSARAFVAAFFCAVLVVIAAVDLERGIIPNRIVVPAGIVVLFGDIAAQPHRWREWTIAAFASMLAALVISLGTRGGIGMGDVKLAFLLGAIHEEAGNRHTYYEWFQWLYEQFEKRELETPAVPAYVAFRDWKP